LETDRKESDFSIPRPKPLAEPVTRMTVTAFRDYLACPYRYYLKHILKLTPLDDRARELDAPAFGSLLHEVLRRFGQNNVRSSQRADEIREFLSWSLNQLTRDTYGIHRLAAVNVQLRQLSVRLDAFATWQAEWAQQGWSIVFSEMATNQDASRLSIDGERSMQLTGRIDRIDRRDDQWFVFDYKSSDSVRTPDKSHRQKGTWIDLQLPLYRFLVQPLEIPIDRLSLGYIVLPKDTTKTGHLPAEWTDAEFEEADTVAVDVARRILDEQFWPPSDPSPIMLDDFASICQIGIL
jgi:ATP-dependent helicase/nuclease subunit B